MASALPAALCWGKDGHYITCKITQDNLTEEARVAVRKLLTPYGKGDLASLCSWADNIKKMKKYNWSKPLHYIITPNVCNFNYSRDCHYEKEEDMCVAGAINNYTSQLEKYGTSSHGEHNLTEALLFLSHFMGDIHQPLHVGFASDRGGVDIKVWDTMIIEEAVKDFYYSNRTLMIQGIQTNISDNWSSDVPEWKNCSTSEFQDNWSNDVPKGNICSASECQDNWSNEWKICSTSAFPCPDRYASESIDLACNWAYMNATNGTTLRDDYFLSRLPIVEKQLAKAGVRLAETLNRIFS
ncbi:hypothetical protein SUGI_0283740 [Cryptomeria japonica]|nr:hypothetical protein SUGI_0283740 [Cryptomeria japonica]